jgi:hypothetical protein
VNEELKALLIQQKEENEKALSERDHLIDELQRSFIEMNERKSAQEKLFQDEIKRIADDHLNEIKTLEEKVA